MDLQHGPSRRFFFVASEDKMQSFSVFIECCDVFYLRAGKKKNKATQLTVGMGSFIGL